MQFIVKALQLGSLTIATSVLLAKTEARAVEERRLKVSGSSPRLSCNFCSWYKALCGRAEQLEAPLVCPIF